MSRHYTTYEEVDEELLVSVGEALLAFAVLLDCTLVVELWEAADAGEGVEGAGELAVVSGVLCRDGLEDVGEAGGEDVGVAGAETVGLVRLLAALSLD